MIMKLKKKIVSLCLATALAITAIGGSTLAYLTAHTKAENIFTVGDISVALVDENGENFTGVKVDNALPGAKLMGETYIKNTGANTAYVRVAVALNNRKAINHAIDDVYEDLYGRTGANDFSVEGGAQKIQDVYDAVFPGWGIQYVKEQFRQDGGTSARLLMTQREKDVESGVTLLNIDSTVRVNENVDNNTAMVSKNNWFGEDGLANDGFIYYGENDSNIYGDVMNDNEMLYVFYLELESGKSYKLFDGIKIPDNFDSDCFVKDTDGKVVFVETEPKTVDQMAAFEDLAVGIYVDAIQAEGMDIEKDAFDTLNDAHPMGWWRASFDALIASNND